LALERVRREASFFAHMFKHRRDFCAGGLMILFGLIPAVNGPNYHIGTLTRMGPGFMPTVLGVILIILGVMIAATATVEAAVEGETHGEHGDENLLPAHPQWLAWLCILSGPFLFIVFGTIGGMAPGTFACVFVSGLGDKDMNWKRALILATVVTIFGVALFHYLLQIPMPVLEWKSPLQAWWR